MQTDPQEPDESIFEKRDCQEEDAVQVVYGIYACTLPLTGKLVADARELFSQFHPIHCNAVPILDGNRVSEDTLLTSGQWLMFVRADTDLRC